MSKYYLGQIRDDNNILAVFVKRLDEDSIGFYDSDNNLLAEWNPPVPLEAANEYRERSPEFLFQIDSLWQDILRSGTSIEKRTRELEAVADALGLDVESILGFSSAELSQKIEDRKIENDRILADKESAEKEDSKDPNRVTDSVSVRSEVNLNKLVDDRYTLADILGIDDPQATLICVNSNDIKSAERSNSEFSFLIKHSDGTLERADMLSQDDGTSPDRDVYSSNRDGSDVDKVAVRSMYRIKSPTGKDCMISVSFGSTGTLNLQYGKRDITEQDFMSVPLEDQKYTRYVTKEVQDSIDPERGIYQAHKSTEEASSHIEKGCDDLTLEEADGNEDTGHTHLDDDHLLLVASNILNKNPELEEFYSLKGLADDLKMYLANNSSKTIEDFTEDRLADCSHYPSIKK